MFGKLMLPVAALLLLNACAAINSEIYRKQTSDLYRNGKALYKSKKYIEAKKQFEQLLEKDPNHYEGNYALGSVYFVMGDYRNAQGYFKAAVDLNDDVKAKRWLLESYLQLGDLKAAREQITGMDEKTASKYGDRIERLAEELKGGAQLKYQEKKLCEEAVELFDSKEYDQALKPLLKIYKKEKNFLQVNIYLTLAYLHLGDDENANKLSRTVVENRGGDLYLGRMVPGERKRIMEAVDKPTDKGLGDYPSLLIGLLLAQNGPPESVKLVYLNNALKGIRHEELSSDVAREIGSAYWRAQSVDKAVKYYDLSLKKKPDQIELLKHFAHIQLYRLGDSKKATELAQAILKYEPQNTFARQLAR